MLDFFAGSGTTAEAVMSQNDRDGGRRKYVLVEMGPHFDTVLRPRLMKVVYSRNSALDSPRANREGATCSTTFGSNRTMIPPRQSARATFTIRCGECPANYTNGLPGTLRVDLVASFNLLLGLRVRRQWTDGGLWLVGGEDSQGKPALIAWRNVRETDDKRCGSASQLTSIATHRRSLFTSMAAADYAMMRL